MSSIAMTTDPGAQRRPQVDRAPRVCWCGQDLEPSAPDHCPRCGQASVTHSRVVPLAQAA